MGIYLLLKIKLHQQYNFLPATYIYLAGVNLSYLASFCYHATAEPKLKNFFRIIDHCFIFISIPASYTPVLLLVFNDSTWSLPVLYLLWILTAIGCFEEIRLGLGGYQQQRTLPVKLFLIMSLLLWLLAPKFVMSFSTIALLLLLSSVIMSSWGSYYYYQSKKTPTKVVYYHGLWHIFILISSLLFFLFYDLSIYHFS